MVKLKLGLYSLYIKAKSKALTQVPACLLEDAVIASSTGCGDIVVRAHEAQVHGQERTAHVGDGKGYAEGIHLLERLQAWTRTAQQAVKPVNVSDCKPNAEGIDLNF